MVCVVITAPASALVVWAWQGECWILPWSHMLSGRLREEEDQETLELSFSAQRLIARGHNLRQIVNDVAGFRVGCLRQFPPEYRNQFSADAPFIGVLEVHIEK